MKTRHLRDMAAPLNEREANLVVLKGRDTTTPAGRFLFHAIGVMGEYALVRVP